MMYVCCQPSNQYFAWQIEVMMDNFVRFGIEPYKCYIIITTDNVEPFIKLRDKYKFNLIIYPDTRTDKSYIPSIYFHLLKKFIGEYNPQGQIFLHDADIVLVRKLTLPRGKNWFVADTRSYLNYDYVAQYGIEQYRKMCEIVKIDPIIPKLMNNNTGGAQYLINNTDYAFWDKVERNSNAIYDLLKNGGTKIQSFTAGMWSVMYNAWKVGHETIISDELGFVDAVTPIEIMYQKPIMHNAGVADKGTRNFRKGDYINTLPYKVDLDIDETKASYYYYQQMKMVESVL